MDLIIQSKNNHVGNSLLLLQNCWAKILAKIADHNKTKKNMPKGKKIGD
jgi:hypothetical protein